MIDVCNGTRNNICCLVASNIYLILVVGTGNIVALIPYAQYIAFNNRSHSKQRRVTERYSGCITVSRRICDSEIRSIQLLFSRDVAASIQILGIRNLFTGLVCHEVEQVFYNFCISSAWNDTVNTVSIGNKIRRIVVHLNSAVVDVFLCSGCEVHECTIGFSHSARNSNTKWIVRTDFAEHSLDIIDIGNHTISTDIPIGPAPVFDIESACQNWVFCLTDTEIHGRLCIGLDGNLLHTIDSANSHIRLVDIAINNAPEADRSDGALRKTLGKNALGVLASVVSEETLNVAVHSISCDSDLYSISNLHGRNRCITSCAIEDIGDTFLFDTDRICTIHCISSDTVRSSEFRKVLKLGVFNKHLHGIFVYTAILRLSSREVPERKSVCRSIYDRIVLLCVIILAVESERLIQVGICTYKVIRTDNTGSQRRCGTDSGCLVNLIKGYTRILIVCNHIYPYCFDTDTLLGISAVSYLNVAELCVSHAVTIEHRSLCICCPSEYTHSRHRYGRCIQLFCVAS